MNLDLSITALQAWIFLPAAVPICLWAVYTDMREFRISNYAVLALMVAFVVLGPIALELNEFLWRGTHFATVLAIGFVLWSIGGIIGAGDVKIAAAMALYFSLPDTVVVLMIWLICILGMLTLHSVPRLIPLMQNVGIWQSRKMPVPFGIALAPTLIIYLILGIIQGAA